MTEREYNLAPGVRRSDLWLIRESPEKYKWFTEHPEVPTPALTFGSAVHKMLLEPDTFFDEFAVAPDTDRRTKAGKEAYEKFMAETAEKTIITMDDLKRSTLMVQKALSIPLVRNLLNGQHELPLFWTDEDTGERCKVRLDCLTRTEDGYAVVDYKTATDARTDVFNSKIFQFGYHLQAYMYTEAVMRSMGLTERPEFILVVQEKQVPYSVNVIRVTEDVIQAGMDTFRELIGILHECKETGYWFGYTGPFDEMNEAYLPGWLQYGNDDDE